jgi:antitoxin HicB
MFLFQYPVQLIAAPAGGYVVRFPDFPEAITQGDDLAEALAQAADCLEEAIAGRIHDRGEIPKPSSSRKHVVSLSALFSAKTALYLALKEAQVSEAELAKRLGWRVQEVRRLLDPRASAELSRFEQALAALGWQLAIAARKVA